MCSALVPPYVHLYFFVQYTAKSNKTTQSTRNYWALNEKLNKLAEKDENQQKKPN